MAQRRKTRRRFRRRARNRIVGWAAGIAVIGGLIWLDRGPGPERAVVNSTYNTYVASARGAGSAYFSAEQGFSGSGGERPHVVVFPYSVIPGGAQDAAELRLALARDPVAAAHYASFDLGHTHVVQLSGELDAYVSYRRDDRIFWTSRKLKIRSGETLLTDGQHFARTRCGNQLAEIAFGPTAPQEPPPAMFDTPWPLDLAPPPLLGLAPPLADEPLMAPPTFSADEPLPGGANYFLPSSFPPLGGFGISTSPAPPIGATPEPDVSVLCAVGLALLLLSKRLGRRRRAR